jgi:plasmid maintenance system antidote protein VapI
MAVRMAELSRSRPETWLQLQNQFDLAQVVQTSGLYSADLGHQVREGLKQSR